MASNSPTIPPPKPETFDKRLREVLLALHGHPLSKRQLLRLNSTFTYPFPIRDRHVRGRTYRESRTLENLLRRAIDDEFVEQSQYSIDGRVTRYFFITERGFQYLFPNQPLPKKTYRSGDARRKTTRRSAFFQPIAHRDQRHEEAVGDVFAQCCVQAKRDCIQMTRCHSRNSISFGIRGDYAMRTPLRTLVRVNPATKQAMPLKIFPDLVIEFETPDGRQYLRPFELDGGTERLLGDDEVKTIRRMVQKYDHHSACYQGEYLIPVITFRQNSRGRLRNVMAVVRETLRDPNRPLFMFATIEHFLAENGALTRPRFFDHFGRSIACLTVDPALISATCSHESGVVDRLRRQLERSQMGMPAVTSAASA